jgi:hypothetical protein
VTEKNRTTLPHDEPTEGTLTSSTTQNATPEDTTDEDAAPVLPEKSRRKTEPMAATRNRHNLTPAEALDRYRAALEPVKRLTDLQLLTKIGEHLDQAATPPSPIWALFLELDSRTRVAELRRQAPRLQADRLNEGAHSIAERAQAVANALAEGSMTPQEANTALYALQVAASALRQLDPKRPGPGRPTKNDRADPRAQKQIPPPTPCAGAGRGHTKSHLPPTDGRKDTTP